jgi:hypothetical protein
MWDSFADRVGGFDGSSQAGCIEGVNYSFIPWPIGDALLRSLSASSLSFEGLDLEVTILSCLDR